MGHGRLVSARPTPVVSVPPRALDPVEERLQVGLPKEAVAVDRVAVGGNLSLPVPIPKGRLGDAKKARGVPDEQVVSEVSDTRHGPRADTRADRPLSKTTQVCNILLLVPTSRADFGLRIFNPDGSEAEKSGNGLRIVAKYLWDHGRAKTHTFTVGRGHPDAGRNAADVSATNAM